MKLSGGQQGYSVAPQVVGNNRMWMHAAILVVILFYIQADGLEVNALPSLHNSVSLSQFFIASNTQCVVHKLIARI